MPRHHIQAAIPGVDDPLLAHWLTTRESWSLDDCCLEGGDEHLGTDGHGSAKDLGSFRRRADRQNVSWSYPHGPGIGVHSGGVVGMVWSREFSSQVESAPLEVCLREALPVVLILLERQEVHVVEGVDEGESSLVVHHDDTHQGTLQPLQELLERRLDCAVGDGA